MSVKLGTLDISLKLGSADVSAAYIGETLIYSGGTSHDYTRDYFTFKALDSGTFKLSGNSVDYSLDNGATWTTLPSDTNSPTVAANSKILWKATLTPSLGIGRFSSSGRFEVEGNAMSLLYGSNFIGQTSLVGASTFRNLFSGCTNMTSAENLALVATTLSNTCYYNMFNGCSGLTTPPELIATTLTEGCYGNMFQGCTSLTTAPTLSATTLASACYGNMFDGCTSLTTAPELPATTLAFGCYMEMFKGCTSLTTAPILSAATLSGYSYNSMFKGCSRLNAITCLATDISALDSTTDWVYGVASNGTFTRDANMTSWAIGTNGIPTNWTVEPPLSQGNVITYSASAKLAETTTSSANGLHTNAFSGTSGQLTISSHTFANGVGTIKFNGDVKTIGTYAFRGCSGASSIEIPSSVTRINSQAFWGSTSLTSITISATTAPTLNSLVFESTNNCTIYVPCNSIADYSVAIKDGLIGNYEQFIKPWTTRLRGISSCTTIARWNDSGTTCSGQSGYDKYTITALQLSPDSGSTWSYVSPSQSYVSSIEEHSEDCGYVPSINAIITYTKNSSGELDFDDTQIKDENGDQLHVVSHTFDSSTLSGSIEFDGDIYEIGENAFADCYSLQRISLPNTLEVISDYAFTNCSLNGITLPDSFVGFGDFVFDGCSDFSIIKSYPTIPPSIGVDIFNDTPFSNGDGTVYVPSESVSDYENDSEWGQYTIEAIS